MLYKCFVSDGTLCIEEEWVILLLAKSVIIRQLQVLYSVPLNPKAVSTYLKVRRYCRLALHGSIGQSLNVHPSEFVSRLASDVCRR